MNGAAPEFPPQVPVVNYEQLEAEFHAGCSVARNLDVSLTTLAHLVMAAQFAMQADTITVTSFQVLRAFVTDAVAEADFPTEMRKLMDAAEPPQTRQKGGRRVG